MSVSKKFAYKSAVCFYFFTFWLFFHETKDLKLKSSGTRFIFTLMFLKCIKLSPLFNEEDVAQMSVVDGLGNLWIQTQWERGLGKADESWQKKLNSL